ncbi:MAG: SseB family protein [Ruminococcus sp.]|nr:SseB family protein [Ruminococcus sp.]
MYYEDTGFRTLYKNFVAFKLKDSLKKCIENYTNADKANCILTYGYIDHDAGLTMEILAAGIKDGDSFTFFDTSTKARAFIRIGAVIKDEFFFFDDKNGDLSKRYSEKLDILKYYAVSKEIEETQKMTFLNKSRHEYYPDDVMVYLTKQGLRPEGCWVRIIGLGDHFIMGTLLNEPNQNFGYHKGERIAFFVHQQKDKSVILYTDMTPSRKLTAEDLEDGTLLKEAVSIFNKERTEEHFIDILEFLRDSYVWIPCNAVLSDVDMAEFEKVLKESGDNLSSIVGKTFSNKENIRMIPDILQNGEQFFFPIFSSAEEMGEYGEHFSKVQKHILEVIPIARNNDKKVAGIVLNAFTEPFVLDAEIFDIVENMKSRLE